MIDNNDRILAEVGAYVQQELQKHRWEVEEQIRALRQEVPVLDGWDEGKVYANNTLAERDGSLWRYDAENAKWKMIVQVVAEVKLRKADSVGVLEFNKPDGSSFEREIRFAA